MEKESYTKEKMELIRQKVQSLVAIVGSLEEEFPERHFTLDGHLVGSIGEVLAVYHYGVDLYKASTIAHDGVMKDGRQVQIKICQQDNVVIAHEPEYLIVIYLRKDGTIYEVYNGPGKEPWVTASRPDSHNNRHMMVNKLMTLDAQVSPEERIPTIHPIEKMRMEYKNPKKK